MDTRSNRSASLIPAGSNSLTQFLDAVEDQWPGSTRIARLIARHDEWLKRKWTDRKPWYDIITEMLDKNWRDDDEFIYDAE